MNLEKRLEKHLNKSFQKIIEENIKPPYSRYELTDKLTELIGNKFNISSSAVYYAVKRSIKTGQLDKKYDFQISNKGRKEGEITKKDKEYKIYFECTNCGKKHKNHLILLYQKVKLRAYVCPHCEQFGKCHMIVKKGNVTAKKAVILKKITEDTKGWRDCFVDNNMNPIKDPFQEEKK